MRRRLLLLFVLLSQIGSAQSIQFSRGYTGNARNVPVLIYNHAPDYFYLLRYNKSIHDLVLEQRAKPGAEIQRIYPLQLDSVNSKWFDYEKLDYLFFEYDRFVFFVFVKELNNQSTVYLKRIEKDGKASSFLSVYTASVEPGKANLQLSISYLGLGKIQIVQKTRYLNQTSRVQVVVADLLESQIKTKWLLPAENAQTGFSIAYYVAGNGNLYFTRALNRISGFTRRYSTTGVTLLPTVITDSLLLFCYSPKGKIVANTFGISSFSNASQPILSFQNDSLHIVLRASKSNGDSLYSCFFSQRFNGSNLSPDPVDSVPVTVGITEKLRYYDGGDENAFAAKEFLAINNQQLDDESEMMEGRIEGNYYKEILYWRYRSGSHTIQQLLLPRRVFYFQQRTAYKQQGYVAIIGPPDKRRIILLEHRNNKQIQPEQYFYKRFEKQTALRTGMLVAYCVRPEGLEKQIIYENAEYDAVPLRYDGWSQDFVFYLIKNKIERFALKAF